AGANVVDSLPQGTYYVRITDNLSPNLGCASSPLQAVTITQFVPELSIDIDNAANFTLTPSTNCSPNNGALEIINVTESKPNGTTQDNASSNYTFTWYEDKDLTIQVGSVGSDTENLVTFLNTSDATVNNGDTDAREVTGLIPATYYVTIQKDATGCPNAGNEAIHQFIIDDISITPKAVLSTRVDDLYCDNGTDDLNGNGALTALLQLDGTNVTLTDYIVEWYRGESVATNTDDNFLYDNASTASGANVGTAAIGTHILNITGLSTGKYTIYARKTGGTANLGCEETATFEVLRDSTVIFVNPSTGITSTNNFNCESPNGTIQITEVQEDTASIYTIDNYSFSWTKDGVAFSDPANGRISSSTGTNDRLDSLSAGLYTAVVTNTVTGCVSKTDVEITIEDFQDDPTVNFVSKTVTTFCDDSGNRGVGSLEFAITEADGTTGDIAEYTVIWYRDSVVNAANQMFNGNSAIDGSAYAVSGDQRSLDSLSAGYYTVTIQKNDDVSPFAGCTAQRTFEVIEDLDYPTINIPDAQVTHNTLCGTTGNGIITIDDNDITFQGAAGSVSDYNWTISSAIGQAGFPQNLNEPATIADLTGLRPDTITFVAVGAATGCSSSTVSVIILDESIDPVIDSLVMTPNANCTSGTINQGRVEIFTLDGNTPPSNDYTYEWFVGNAATAGQEVQTLLSERDDTTFIENLPEGNYTVRVTNNSTGGCTSTQTIQVTNDPIIPILSRYEVNKDLTCDIGNGSFVVTQIIYNGTTYSMGNTSDSSFIVDNFSLVHYDTDGSTVLTDKDTNTPMKLDSLTEKTYFASIRRNDSNCESQLVQFDLENNPFYPALQVIQVEADSTCSQTGTTPNGTLKVIPDESDSYIHIDTAYTFNWFEVDPMDDNTRLNAGASIGTNDTLTSRYAGRYEVEVYSTSFGCTSNAFFTLTNEPEELRIIAIDSASQTTCSNSDAFFGVTQINIGDLSDYTFNFYNGDPTLGNPTDSLIYTGSSSQLSFDSVGYDVLPDEYYVIATSNVTGCSTGIYQIELYDNTELPLIQLEAFSLQRNCDPSNPSGSLTVSADGSQDNSLYTFEWADSTGTIVESNNATADSLAAGDYTVTITEVASNCPISATFTMIDDYPDPLQISVSSEGNSNCVNPNGVLAATVVNIPDGKSIGNYNFYWFSGDQRANAPDISQAEWTGTVVDSLNSGTYTLYVIDGTDSFCRSDTLIATVRDLVTPIDFRVDIINDVTICYPTQPNGRAHIGFIEDEIFRYNFNWYEGSVTDTTGFTPIKAGQESNIDSLAVGVYTVTAIDLITGCIEYQEFVMMDATVTVPAPSLSKVADRDHCINPNGRAIARANGTTEGFTFNWYIQDDLLNPVFTGSDVATLDSITYLVETVKTSTGCVSAKVAITIGEAFEDPVYEIATTGSICLRTAGNAINSFTGKASIAFEEFNLVDSIIWYNPQGIPVSNDPKLIDAEPGMWSVWFRADNGCDYTREFEITTELKIYNGISANGDDINDFMMMDCIEYFPNNRVSIYNRDGSLVYEVNGYDNDLNRFEGFSNQGRKEKQLPVGTYFYFIDKGDGSDVIQGYLELVR
ncbi:MAG: gliding motility-associated C-terminal domain-containing protein, partial [Cyclobacteriaceae bacterium]